MNAPAVFIFRSPKKGAPTLGNNLRDRKDFPHPKGEEILSLLLMGTLGVVSSETTTRVFILLLWLGTVWLGTVAPLRNAFVTVT